MGCEFGKEITNVLRTILQVYYIPILVSHQLLSIVCMSVDATVGSGVKVGMKVGVRAVRVGGCK